LNGSEKTEDQADAGRCQDRVNDYLEPDGKIIHNRRPFQRLRRSLKFEKQPIRQRSLPPLGLLLGTGGRSEKGGLDQKYAMELVNFGNFFGDFGTISERINDQ
jgi:hypothetical protein